MESFIDVQVMIKEHRYFVTTINTEQHISKLPLPTKPEEWGGRRETWGDGGRHDGKVGSLYIDQRHCNSTQYLIVNVQN